MVLAPQTIKLLREIINEKSQYRSGPQLVEFFNQLGFSDVYSWGGGFPARKDYTDDRLAKINGTASIDKCIRLVFEPRNYVGKYQDLENLISELNSQLSYDGWLVVRNGADISFRKAGSPNIDQELKKEKANADKNDLTEQDFLLKEYSVDLDQLNLSSQIMDIIHNRIEEIKSGISNNMPLATIILIGSTLEGILLDVALKYPKQFNTANATPKDNTTGKPRSFPDWTLKDFIDVAKEIGLIKEDVKKFSHVVREFRNYIHPYEQMSRSFEPDLNTAKICFQVLKAAICQISLYVS